jgi:hypothetical protein
MFCILTRVRTKKVLKALFWSTELTSQSFFPSSLNSDNQVNKYIFMVACLSTYFPIYKEDNKVITLPIYMYHTLSISETGRAKNNLIN